jgi:hypothetical protein
LELHEENATPILMVFFRKAGRDRIEKKSIEQPVKREILIALLEAESGNEVFKQEADKKVDQAG